MIALPVRVLSEPPAVYPRELTVRLVNPLVEIRLLGLKKTRALVPLSTGAVPDQLAGSFQLPESAPIQVAWPNSGACPRRHATRTR